MRFARLISIASNRLSLHRSWSTSATFTIRRKWPGVVLSIAASAEAPSKAKARAHRRARSSLDSRRRSAARRPTSICGLPARPARRYGIPCTKREGWQSQAVWHGTVCFLFWHRSNAAGRKPKLPSRKYRPGKSARLPNLSSLTRTPGSLKCWK